MAIPITNVKLKTVADTIGCNETIKTCFTDPAFNIYGIDANYANVLVINTTGANIDTLQSFIINPQPPYKLGDFRNYRHGMVEPIVDAYIPSFSPSGGTNKVTLTFNKNGLIQQKNLRGYYLGLLFKRQSDDRLFCYTLSTTINNTLGTQRSVDIGEETTELCYQIQEIMIPEYLPDGTYDVYIVGSSNVIQTLNFSGSFIKLSSMKKTIYRTDAQYQIDWNIVASYVPSTRRYTYSVTAKNSGAFACYLTYNIDIINNLDQSVWKHLAGPSQRQIAASAESQLVNGSGEQLGMTQKAVRVQWELRATATGSVLQSGTEIKQFKSV